jgi:hypothetical protein
MPKSSIISLKHVPYPPRYASKYIPKLPRYKPKNIWKNIPFNI